MNHATPVPALISRRQFLLGSAACALAASLGRAAAAPVDQVATTSQPTNAVLVFQGDSITDAGRDRAQTLPNIPAGLAAGYVGILAAQLLGAHPDKGLQVYNRGVSGNRVLDLLDRWPVDTLKLELDLVSILVGVNDTWHQYIGGFGIKVPRYAALYRMLLEDTLERRPQCRLVLCEPFALPGGAFKDAWMEELRGRMAAVRELAKEFNATLVPFQTMFEEAMKECQAAKLAADGVHPTLLGHQLMAKAWRDAVGL